MKLDKNNLTQIVKNIDFDELNSQISKLDININSNNINKLFKSLDMKKAKKGLEILKNANIKNKLADIEPFETINMNVLNRLVDKIDIKKMTKKPRDYTVDSSRTIEQEINLSKQNVNNIKEKANSLSNEIQRKLGMINSLKNADDIITDDL